MKRKGIYISHVLFPWETFAAQAEREQRELENDGARWTDEFLEEVRENVLRYANETNLALRNCSLNDIYRLVPFHFRNKIFSGVYFPIFDQ